MSINSDERDKFFTKIEEAWRAGRPIVPLFGAGCSYEAGMPVIDGLVRYLGKVRSYLNEFLYVGPEAAPLPLAKLFEMLAEQPASYLETFGWPGRFEIHAELCEWLENRRASRIEERASRIEKRESRICQMVEELVKEGKQQILKKSLSTKQNEDLQGLLNALGAAKEVTEVKEALKNNNVKLEVQDTYWYLGDWRDAITHFTNHQEDLSDALINRLHIGRQPALCHQYAAFLTRLNVWNLLLTYNFDPLFEMALEHQEIPHRVFSLEEGVHFPGELLLRNSTAVLKLHGDSHRLLLDYRLDQPLSTEYLKRLDRCLQQRGNGNPLLLVLGCSGNDNRVMSLVRHFQDRYKHVSGSPPPNEPTVAWVYFGDLEDPKLPTPGSESILEDPNLSVQSRNPGYFLKELYGRLVGRYPSSRTPYISHSERPTNFQAESPHYDDGFEAFLKSENARSASFCVIDGYTRKPPPLTAPSASQRLAEFVREKASFCQVIWIDFEACYSLADVVGMIVDQAKRYDTGTTPFAMRQDPVEGDNSYLNRARESFAKRPEGESREIEKAVQRVVRILRRSHFLVALDGLETLASPPTAHHGDVRSSHAYMHSHLHDVVGFLLELEKKKALFRGSRVFVSVDRPKPRHDAGKISPHVKSFLESAEIQPLCHELTHDHKVPVKEISEILHELEIDEQRGDLVERIAFRIACFRRTRGIVELQLAFPGEIEKRSGWLTQLAKKGVIHRVDGGGYWMNRSLRDAIYSHLTQYTSTNKMASLLGNLPSGTTADKHKGDRRMAAKETFRGFVEHDCLANIYFDKTYLLSLDATSFFEYVYHRVSAIRYLTKLIALLQTGDKEAILESIRELQEGWSRCLGQTTLDELSRKDLNTQLLTAIRLQRINWLVTAWREASEDLRARSNAGQIIFWVRWLLGEDFMRMQCALGGLIGSEIWCNWDDANGRLKDAGVDPEVASRSFVDEERSRKPLLELEAVLLTLWFESAFERMDFDAAENVARMRLLRIPRENTHELKSWQLNEQRAKAYNKVFKGTGYATEIAGIFEPQDEHHSESALHPRAPGNVDPQDKHDSELALDARAWRFTALLAALEFHLGKQNVVDRTIKNNDLPNFEEQFFGYAAEGPTREEKKGKKALFTTLRMWVHIIKARVMALRETDSKNEKWDCIYKELNYARAAASRDLAHRRVIVELFSAIVTSQHIERLILPRPRELPLNPDNERETAASAKCRLLRLVLDRAKEQLGKGRRNTRWWRLYFRLEIRWALWELLSLKRQIERQKDELERPEEVVARLLETVRCGLAAMSSRIDLDFGYANSYEDFGEQPFANLHKWWLVLGRLWASTIFCISKKVTTQVTDKYKIDIDAEGVWGYALKVHYPWLSRVVGLPMPKGVPPELHDGNPHEENHELLKPLTLERWVNENTSVLTLIDPG